MDPFAVVIDSVVYSRHAQLDEAEAVAYRLRRWSSTLTAIRVVVLAPDPEPPTPPATATPAPRRFDRAAHCQAIGAGGGARTAALYGSAHYRTIGRAGARATIAKHGLDTYLGILKAKGYAGSRKPCLVTDLAIGEYLAAA